MNNTDMLIKELEAAKVIHKQIVMLSAESNFDKAINQVLSCVGEYMKAQRVYIFEDKGELYPNTYEWCNSGVSAEIDNLQNVNKNEITHWTSVLEKGECIVIGNIENIRESSPYIYDLLSMQDIHSCIEAPIMIGKELVGFIGVDNAPSEMNRIISDSLLTLGTFIGISINNRKEHQRLIESYDMIAEANDTQNKLVDSVSGGIFSYTLPERKVLIFNSEARRILGYKEHCEFDFISSFHNRIIPGDYEVLKKVSGLLKKPGDSSEYTIHINSEDGIQAISCNSKRLAFADGQQYIISSLTDITKEEKLEEILDDERKQYRDALTRNSAFNFSVDLTDGLVYDSTIITHCNDPLADCSIEFPVDYDDLMKAWLDMPNAVALNKDAVAIMKREDLIDLYNNGSSSCNAEYYIPTADKYYHILVLLFESKRNPNHITANLIAFDTTERKLEEEKTRSIIYSLSSIYYCVYHCMPEEDRCDIIKYYNDVEKSLLFDGTYKDFVRTYVSDCIVPSFKNDVSRFLDIESIKKRLADTDSVSIEYQRKNVGWCRATMAVSKRDKDGDVKSFLLAINVIEDEKQKELQSLHEIQQQWHISKSFSEIYFASWIVDFDEDTLDEINVPDFARDVAANNGATESLAYLVNKYVSDDFKDSMSDFMNIETLRERISNKEIISMEYYGMVSGWCRANFIPLDDGSNRFIFAVQNIDEEKEKENQTKMALMQAYDAVRAANRAKTDFLANMSHDIRTPMNAIIGMTAIAGAHIDDKQRVVDCLNKITVSSKHLLGIINEVLDMSKIESGKLSLQEEVFSLPELIDELLVMCRPQILDKKHSLAVNIKSISHEKVIGDSQRIQQVFMNLMSNAIKYTRSGGNIRFSVSEKPTNKQRIGCYEFVFEDNGIGMSEEFLSHIFEPFERANDSEIAKIQGTGLGMPIAYNIVQMMNGDIEIESELGKGTKITVTIFLKLVEADNEIDYNRFVSLPVLVTDDDVMACESACDILTELGMESEWVLSGKEAVERTVQRHNDGNDYFAVIIDWKMPEMDGVATAKEIRKRVGDDVPVLIISSYDWSDIEQEARAAGVNGFISKPLFKSRLAYLFNELLGNGNSSDSLSHTETVLGADDFSGKRILLVEDNEINAEIAGEILTMSGIEVEYATDGQQAVDIMADSQDGYFDMIFMDIQMPVMNGYEAAAAIRALGREYTDNIPIVAMTANAFAEDVQKALNSGMNEHISKPLDMTRLSKSLHKWL